MTSMHSDMQAHTCEQFLNLHVVLGLGFFFVYLCLNDVVLAWLSIGSKVQIFCIWFSWCHCHPSSLASL